MPEFVESGDGSQALLDGYSRLMAGILIQALIDSQSSDYAERVDAITWLATEEAEYFAEVCGLPGVFKRWCRGVTFPERSIGVNGKYGWRIKSRPLSRTRGYT